MDAKKIKQELIKWWGEDDNFINGFGNGDEGLVQLFDRLFKAKSKEEAEERFNKACEDYFNTYNTKTVQENLYFAAFGKEER